jgi:hypothetical protein
VSVASFQCDRGESCQLAEGGVGGGAVSVICQSDRGGVLPRSVANCHGTRVGVASCQSAQSIGFESQHWELAVALTTALSHRQLTTGTGD